LGKAKLDELQNILPGVPAVLEKKLEEQLRVMA